MMEGLEMNRTITGNVGMDTVECKIQTCTRTEVETGLIGTPEPDVCSSPVSSVTRDFEDQQRVAMSSISIQDHRVLESWKSANAVTCDLDEMEFTRSKTVVIDSVGVERTNEPAPVDPQDHYTEFLCQESVLPEGNTHVADSADSVVMYGDNRSEEPIKSRRKSLADLQSKLQSILQCMNHSNEEVAGSVTAPLPQLRERLTETEGLKELRTTATSDELRNNSLSEGSERKTMGSWQNKALTARISVGGFLPKLPSRPKPTDPDPVMSKIAAAVQNDYTTCEPNGSFETVDNLNDIELPEMSTNEDVSETLDRNCLNKTMDIETPSEVPVQDDEDSATSQGLKRPFPEDHQETEDSQRKRPQSESPIQEMVPSSPNVLWDSKGPAGSVKTMDCTNSSSNSTNIKCEATFESMYKSAEMQGDSQMDYETMDSEFDFHKKVEDGSITVNEFLRHFGIDFVIHRSRPSALPEKFVPDDKQSIEHHLRELHIYRPKQRVYDAECEKLTELVEGLKPRMLEQDSLLRNVNKSLLQEMLVLSKEQLQSFGSKLKERKGYFRKRSKARSHEMKVGMYSELVHTVQEAEESLREKITKADKWLEELDACAHGLEMEISAIDSAVTDSFDLPPILETRQKELDTLDVALEKKQRHLTQLGCEKMALGEKLVILQKKTREMENHIHLLDSVNEWKLSQKCNSGALFSFLYNSIQLEVTFQQSKGEHGLSNQSEQDLLDISFHFLLDADKSECHANMLHKLIYQYTQSKKNWTEEYQTTRDIPMLLHDVSLVVSRCRLLGEEIHRLKKWGALRLGILEISCSDTMVSVLFSSLKAFVKFQITLDIPSSYPFGCLKIQHLHNYIGETRMDQVAASVSSVTPAKNYLTKVLKIIHDDLLA
ncbi:kinetochore scaffold 1-like [Denticeps clupeoides]|uniref:kinetochore scaffold 1-like n=1 Tax=Denticeps clupeoides TaxID=299321 RepID=UPI0010A37EF0|nr:kinetochore scaffold 1-like [Denticeps clupeoides]